MANVKFTGGDITVEGIEGVFSQTLVRTFVHIHHCILNENGIGCKKREFVGSVCKGNFADPSQGIRSVGNKEFGNMVEEKIEKYIAR